MPEFEFLFELRNVLGPLSGSDNLCFFLYSLVLRERPVTVVELGTGLGVSTAWMARALSELGQGSINTVDDSSIFLRPGFVDDLVRLLKKQRGASMQELADHCGSYDAFLEAVFRFSGVAHHVNRIQQRIDLHDSAQFVPERFSFLKGPIDVLFSDFQHGPNDISALLSLFLPKMSGSSSVLIDSAPTHLPSYLLLAEIIELLNRNKVPQELLVGSEEHDVLMRKFVSQSRFTMMHLFEKIPRNNNSTAWIRIEPLRLSPPPGIMLH